MKSIYLFLRGLMFALFTAGSTFGQTQVADLPHGNLLDTIYAETWQADLWMSGGRLALLGKFTHHYDGDRLLLYNVIRPDSLDSLGRYGGASAQDAAHPFSGIYMKGDDLVTLGSSKVFGIVDPWEIVTQTKIEAVKSISDNRELWSSRESFDAPVAGGALVTGAITAVDSLLVLDRGSWGIAVAQLIPGDSLRIFGERIYDPEDRKKGSISVDGRLCVELLYDGSSELAIYDLSDPANISQIGSLDIEGGIYRDHIQLVDDKLWILGADLMRWDLSDPTEPVNDMSITIGSMDLDWERGYELCKAGKYLAFSGYSYRHNSNEWGLIDPTRPRANRLLLRGTGRLKKIFEANGYLTILTEVGDITDDSKQYFLQWVDAREVIDTVVTEDPVFPISFRLHSAYPNPFNSRTFLTLDVPAQALYDFELFDAGGRRVLFERREMLLGANRYTLDGAGLPTGEYLLRVSSGRWERIGKVALQK